MEKRGGRLRVRTLPSSPPPRQGFKCLQCKANSPGLWPMGLLPYKRRIWLDSQPGSLCPAQPSPPYSPASGCRNRLGPPGCNQLTASIGESRGASFGAEPRGGGIFPAPSPRTERRGLLQAGRGSEGHRPGLSQLQALNGSNRLGGRGTRPAGHLPMDLGARWAAPSPSCHCPGEQLSPPRSLMQQRAPQNCRTQLRSRLQNVKEQAKDPP